MSTSSRSHEALTALAAHVGEDWKHAKDYYDAAEADMERRWTTLVWPFISRCDFEICVDLAAGHGRNTARLLQQRNCKKVYCVDINQQNVDYCLARFANDRRVVCMKNDGVTLADVPSQSITMFYCFDAMVHFDSDIVRSYLGEIARLLEPTRGRAFLHHSNFSGNPGGDVHANPHWRNFMTAALMKHYAAKEGLAVERQELLDWNCDNTNIDCFTLLRIAT
jgi:SAM-dependent methyltransferase